MSVKKNLVSRLTRTRLLFPLLFILLLLPAVYFYATRPKETAAWWNESWIYRKRIDISNPGGSDLTDFQISFTLDTTDTNKFQSNCEDLRITGVDGNLLPFWIEENNPGCGDANTKVWVKLPSIPSSGTYIYAYYGNPSASVSSDHDGNKVFEFFDDFESYQLNQPPPDYTVKGTATALIKDSSGKKVLEFYSASTGTFIFKNDLNLTDFRLHSSAAASNNYFALITRVQNTDLRNFYAYNYGANTSTKRYFRYVNDVAYNITSISESWNNSQFYPISIKSIGNTISFYDNDTLKASTTWTDFSSGSIGIANGGTNITQQFRYFFVTKTATTDPTTSAQTEEVGPGPVAYWKFDEGTGNTANDSTSNSNHGSLSGTEWLLTNQCVADACIDFDGVNIDTVNIPHHESLNFGTNSFTISGWALHRDYTYPRTNFAIKKSSTCYASGSGNAGFDIGHGYKSDGIDICIHDTADNRIRQTLTFDSGYTPNELVNTWTHYVFVIDRPSAKIKAFINGVKQSNELDISAITDSINNSSNLVIGSLYGWKTDGKMDELKIFPYILSNDQIKNEYNLGSNSIIGKGTYSISTTPISESLISYWPMDELSGQTAYDKVENNHTTLGADTNPGTDDPSWKPSYNCKINGCLEFDGSYDVWKDQHLYTSFNQISDYPFTVSAWLKPSTPNESRMAISLYRGVSQYFAIGTSRGGSNTWSVEARNTTSRYLNSPASTATQEWTHLSAIFHSSTQRELYVNGEKMGEDNIEVPFIQPLHLYIGKQRPVALDYGHGPLSWNGLVDEVRIYNTALSPEQIKQDMNAGSTLAVGTTNREAADFDDGEGNPPVAEWKFDEKTGSTTNDTSGNNNTGTITGATWKSAKDCKIGACLEFNGDDYISCQSSSEITALSAFTVEAWVKTTSTTYNPIISLNNTYYGVHIPWSNGRPLIYLGPSNYRYFSSDTPTTVSDGDWHHIAAIITGNQQSDINNAKLYIDGKEQNIYSTTSSGAPDSISLCRIARAGGFYNTGLIDHVKIYDYARTPAQIAYDYNRGEPIAHWKMDECQGSTIHDSSDNGNHGTWNGSGGTQTSVGTCTTAGTAWGNGSTGKFGASLNFDGEDDYLVKTSPNNLPTKSEATWSWWSKTSNSSWLQAIIGEHRNQWSIRQSNNSVFLGINAEQLGPYSFTTDNNWSHYAITFKSGDVKFYKNGNLIQEASTSATSTVPSLATLYIGRRSTAPPNSYNFSGQLDDVRIYNYALSATQIKKVMNEGSSLRFGE
jgi:hypothetical protein